MGAIQEKQTTKVVTQRKSASFQNNIADYDFLLFLVSSLLKLPSNVRTYNSPTQDSEIKKKLKMYVPRIKRCAFSNVHPIRGWYYECAPYFIGNQDYSLKFQISTKLIYEPFNEVCPSLLFARVIFCLVCYIPDFFNNC